MQTMLGVRGLVVLAAIAGVVFAYQLVERPSGETFAVGEVDIMIDNESYYNGVANEDTSWELTDLTVEKFFNFTDVKPQDYGEDTVSIHVALEDTFLCADVTLTSNDENGCNEPEGLVDGSCGNPGEGEGELAGLIEFIWWADDGDNVFEDNETIISEGPLGALTLDVPHTVTLADSAENIWTGVGGAVPEGATNYIGKAWCYGDITPQALAQDGQDDAWSPADDNDNNGFAGEPEDGGFTCDGEPLGNISQTDSLTMDVAFNAVQEFGNEGYLCGETTRACIPDEAFADHIVSFSQGLRKNGTPVLLNRSDPTDALGAPQSGGTPYDNPVVAGSFVSLGFDGTGAGSRQIVVEFTDNIIVDDPGDDLRVWEVTGGNNYPDEHIMVEASQDGSAWFTVAADLIRDADADLADAGLAWARFIRLTDVTDPTPFEATADAYDLDAVSALNCEAPVSPFAPLEI